MGDELACPKCGAACERDEVDVGVGVVTGPWACRRCGWDQADEIPPALPPMSHEEFKRLKYGQFPCDPPTEGRP